MAKNKKKGNKNGPASGKGDVVGKEDDTKFKIDDNDESIELLSINQSKAESMELSTNAHDSSDVASLASTDAIHQADLDDLKPNDTDPLSEHDLNPDLNRFMIACQNGNLSAVEELISQGKVNVGDTFSDMATGLHWACINNRLSVVKYLMSQNADPNAVGGDLKATPLHWAARNGLVYIVDYLLSNSSADPSLIDSQAYNALHLAVHSSNITMIVYLLLTCVADANYEHKLYIDEPENSNRTALHWAAYQGDILTVNALLKFGADVSKVDDSLFIPIHWAFMKGYKSVLKALLEAGSDIFVKNDQGKNTFDIAKDMNCYSTWTKILTDNGRSSKHNWIKQEKFIQPQVGKLITFFTPYILLPTVFYICDFHLGYIIPKIFFSSILTIAVVFILSKFIIKTYLVDDNPLPKSPFLAGIFLGTVFWVMIVYLYRVFPALIFSHFLVHVIMFALVGTFSWAFFKTMFINPGYIHVPSDNSIILSQVRELISLGRFDTDNFCVNSFIRKPLRSKYSKASGRLVAKFDHYCPWVYNEVGVRNHKLFLAFVYLLNISMFIFIYLSLRYFDKYEDRVDSDDELSCFILNEELCYGFNNYSFHFNILIWTILQAVWVTFLSIVQTFQILRGVTTMEFSTIGHVHSANSRFNHSTVPQDFSTASSPIVKSNGNSTELKTCLRIIGVDQLIMTIKLSIGSLLSRADNSGDDTMNGIVIPTDYGFKQNWLDFWIIGEVKLRNVFYLPIEGENNLNGELVDYYKLYEYPAKDSSVLV